MHNISARKHFEVRTGLMEFSCQLRAHIPDTEEGFIPQEAPDHPLDVTLVVEGGKRIKAHKRVLSQASAFFEKLLNIDMRESNEGVVRLEMATEACMKDILEFIYTGSIEITTEDNAKELIIMADYLVLPQLKTLAEKVLVDNLELNARNCISVYTFAERYDCKELVPFCKNFILANFPNVAKTEQFLNLSCEEVKTWLSNDEINVSSEDDVFRIILTWIKYSQSVRTKHFAELFLKVRLVYVSRDFLLSDVMTNDFVHGDKGFMGIVKDAVAVIDSDSCHHLNVKPRKSLEYPVVVICMKCVEKMDQFLCCYHPYEDKWSSLFGKVPLHTSTIISSDRKLYFISQNEHKLFCYDSFFNCWNVLPYEEQRRLDQVFVKNDEIHALVTEDQGSCQECVSLRSRSRFHCGRRHLSFLVKYKPESNTWEEITSFNLDSKIGICVVAKDNFIYFLGGYSESQFETLADVDKYNLTTNMWEKVADLHEPRQNATGAAAYGKIFVAGGINKNNISKTCEVYYETTNEWQFISSFEGTHLDKMYSPVLMCCDDTLYLLMRYLKVTRYQVNGEIGCVYELDENEWRVKTQIPSDKMLSTVGKLKKTHFITSSCSMKIFKGHHDPEKASFPQKHKCLIM